MLDSCTKHSFISRENGVLFHYFSVSREIDSYLFVLCEVWIRNTSSVITRRTQLKRSNRQTAVVHLILRLWLSVNDCERSMLINLVTTLANSTHSYQRKDAHHRRSHLYDWVGNVWHCCERHESHSESDNLLASQISHFKTSSILQKDERVTSKCRIFWILSTENLFLDISCE